MASNAISKTQIDLLGDRLRSGVVSEDDLRLLDRIRRSYSPGYNQVISLIREKLGFEPTGRPAKSTSAIVEKLQRETIRLSQMQDIAGCRIIVPDAPEQERAVRSLQGAFAETTLVDRRITPSHGYRAVHVIVTGLDMPIEIQIRTILQHSWAEMSEKFADVIDPSIKYGGGPSDTRDALALWSDLVRRFEAVEIKWDGNPSAEIVDMQSALRREMEQVIGNLSQL